MNDSIASPGLPHAAAERSGFRRFAMIFLAAFVLAAMPVLRVDLLPLLDYPNHLARMHILLHLADSAVLRQFYHLAWGADPNLAMDLLVPPLARLMPLAWAGKVFVLMVLFAVAAGPCLLHRALHGRWSAWPLLGMFLVHSGVFLAGFLNYALGMGLACAALAGWLLLRRRGWGVQLAYGTGASLALYCTHLCALAGYGVLLAGIVLMRWPLRWRAVVRAGLPFLPPLALLALDMQPGGDPISYDWGRKLDLWSHIAGSFDPVLDAAAAFVLIGVPGILLGLGMLRLDRRLLPGLGALVLCWLALPSNLMGGAGLDWRLPPFIVLVAVAGLAPARATPLLRAFAALACIVLALRVAAVSFLWLDWQGVQQPILAAMAQLPPGSRMAIALPPTAPQLGRGRVPLPHVAAYAAILADAFVPNLFTNPGQQPLRLNDRFDALANAVAPEEFWARFVTGAAPSAKLSAALRQYDALLLVSSGEFDMPDPPHSARLLASPHARLYRLIPQD